MKWIEESEAKPLLSTIFIYIHLYELSLFLTPFKHSFSQYNFTTQLQTKQLSFTLIFLVFNKFVRNVFLNLNRILLD